MLSRLSIQTRGVAMFAALPLCILAIAGTAFLQARSMAAASEEVAGTWMLSISNLGQFSEAIGRFRQLQAYDVLAPDAETRTEVRRRKRLMLARTEEAWRAYDALVVPGEERRLADAIAAAWRDYLAHDARLTALVDAGDTVGAARLLTVDLLPAATRFLDAINADQVFNRREAAAAAAGAARAYARMVWALGIVGGLGFAIAAVSAVWLNRSVIYRLVRLSGVIGQLARRDYAFDLPCTVRHDEIGAMARAPSTRAARG